MFFYSIQYMCLSIRQAFQETTPLVGRWHIKEVNEKYILNGEVQRESKRNMSYWKKLGYQFTFLCLMWVSFLEILHLAVVLYKGI